MVIDSDYAVWLYLLFCVGLGTIVLTVITKAIRRSESRILSAIGWTFIVLFLISFSISSITMWHKKVTYVFEIDESECREYAVLGSCAYQAADEQVINVSPDSFNYLVVNVTDRMMMVENVWYATWHGEANREGDEFPAHSFHFQMLRPDYFPWQTPPGEITAGENSIMTFKRWYYFQDQYPNGTGRY